MSSLQSLFQDTFVRRRTVVIIAALVLTSLVPFADTVFPGEWSAALLGAGALLVMATLFQLLRPGRPGNPDTAEDPESPGQRTGVDNARPGAGLLLYLSPVILLNLVYPLVSPEMAAANVGGVQLTYLVLASSITVPWLAQAACLPAYRLIGDLMAERNMPAITRRFCANWPAMFGYALPLVVLFAIPLWLASRWSFTAMATYAALCALHLLFVQSLVLANVGNRRGLWALAWVAYAAALFAVPTLWWLPPLLGAATQIAAMGRGLASISLRNRPAGRNFARDVVRGLLLGAVLWADKYLLFLATDGDFPVVIVFVSMLPAVIAYNYYFVHLAPRVDKAVTSLHRSIAEEPLTVLAAESKRLTRTVDRAILSTGAVGMILTLVISLVIDGFQPENTLLAVCVGTASWAFMVLTLLSYELDYIGVRMPPQLLGGIHLALCAGVFALAAASTSPTAAALAYAALVATDVLLVAVAWVLYKRHWSQPEYTLFWRHATSW
ncbi:hypothetical protein H9639_14185 [Arthrobacter sp. Sa2CUA1]|uniref:Uncharacterized protein n=1 Tax=Arthrobacter gallicola TaxID=2762225 RepID=A0ABR8UV52_9MICC|nr:hypothetical protein [Arthrobacter gallicola]MBD7996447.1 hypothetical protein [Arthrobacter gallicola]